MVRRLHPGVVAALWAVAVCLLATVPSAGQGKEGKHVQFRASIRPADPFSDMNQPGAKMAFRRGEVFTLTITGVPEKGWHTYPLTKKSPEQEGKPSKVQIVGGDAFQPLYPISESEPQWKTDKQLGSTYLEHEQPFTWSQDVYVKPTAPVGQTVKLPVKVEVYVCAGQCIDESYALEVPVAIAPGEEVPLTPELKTRLSARAPTDLQVVPIPENMQAVGGPPVVIEGNVPPGLFGSIVTAVIGGWVSLLTPCVFPMIPITVSFFLKQNETSRSGAAVMALIYSGTIVVVLAAGGLALLHVLVQISTHYVTNFAIGAIFLFFAMSLLGWYDITLPSWLQDVTSSREGQGGFLGVFFMALTFSIISFACVGPIYGGFISLEASGQASGSAGFLRLLLPVLAYSVAFAAPFFVLALFPSFLKSMPRAGSWMNAVKVVMGFLELAAVVKFLRAGELALTGRSELLTYDLCLGLYVTISLACGLYLLGLYRLPHDHDAPESIGVPRLLFSLAFITLGLYLLPGIFKGEKNESQRPKGVVFAWVDSFLLPDPEEAPGWHHNLNEALEQAKKDRKLVFVDFTGTQCTNCKLNERYIFPRQQVKAALEKHVLLKLYTDTAPAGSKQVPNEADAVKLRDEVFKNKALPIYGLVRPKGDSFEIVAVYNKGLIAVEQIPEFIEFLSKK